MRRENKEIKKLKSNEMKVDELENRKKYRYTAEGREDIVTYFEDYDSGYVFVEIEDEDHCYFHTLDDDEVVQHIHEL
jgi:hypothetical protein